MKIYAIAEHYSFTRNTTRNFLSTLFDYCEEKLGNINTDGKKKKRKERNMRDKLMR